MKSILLLCVGKLKSRHWMQAADQYSGLLSRHVRLEQAAVKDAPAHLGPEQKIEAEGRTLLAKLGPKELVLGLHAGGRAFSSEEFAGALGAWLEDPVRRPCFVIGGAFGLSSGLLSRCDLQISLGPMTLPHELARVVLLEQLYRAVTILRGTGYHH